MTEAELTEANGLVAHFYGADAQGNRRAQYEERQLIQRRLLVLGVRLTHPDPTPDPRAPEGGSTAAIREAKAA